MPTVHLPPISDAHRRAAFAMLAMPGWSYAAALRDPLRAKLIECRAAQLRTREWQAQHSQATECVRRIDPITGRWCTQRVAGAWVDSQPSLSPTTTD